MDITLAVNAHNTTALKNRTLEWIAIHYCANTTSKKGAALNVAGWFKNPQNTGGSADFIVDDVLTVQYNPDIRNRYCWAVGGKRYFDSKGASMYGVATNRNTVSIEICSTSATGAVLKENDKGWSFTKASLERAADLALWLCHEYGIPVTHIIRHYDVSGKLCPGIIGWNKESGSEDAWKAFQTLIKSRSMPVSNRPVSNTPDTENALWNFLKSKGLNDFAIAGIMGNLYAESGLRPDNLQDTFEKRLQLTDEEYTESVDEGSYQEFASDGAGYGIAQWTYWKRKEGLYDLSKLMDKSVGSLDVQMAYLWKELTKDYSRMRVLMDTVKSVREASDLFLFQFERPLNQGEDVQMKRAKYAMDIYERHADFVSFTVKVTANTLNIRSGAGTSFQKNGAVHNGEVYTIVGVTGDWGKLKSGAGWINLNYTECV